MSSVDSATFNSFTTEVSLPSFTPSLSPEAQTPNEQAIMPEVSQRETSHDESGAEILVPGKNWEYIADYPLQKLKPHPLQTDLFVGLNDAGISELAADIRKRGLQNPLEVLVDGTMINGHQRFLAFKRLGLETIPVYIRHDFHDQPGTAVKEHIVQDNLQRKHLHPLEIARGYQQLRQLLQEQEAVGEDRSFTIKELRQDLTKRFGISGRTLDRYVAALKAPSLIQNACIQGKISFHIVCKIGKLSQDKIQSLMAKIQATGDLPAVVAEYAQQGRGAQLDSMKAFIASGRQLRRRMIALVEKLDKIPSPCRMLQMYRPVLKEHIFLLAQLLGDLKNPTAHSLSETLLARDVDFDVFAGDLHGEFETVTSEDCLEDVLSLGDS